MRNGITPLAGSRPTRTITSSASAVTRQHVLAALSISAVRTAAAAARPLGRRTARRPGRDRPSSPSVVGRASASTRGASSSVAVVARVIGRAVALDLADRAGRLDEERVRAGSSNSSVVSQPTGAGARSRRRRRSACRRSATARWPATHTDRRAPPTPSDSEPPLAAAPSLSHTSSRVGDQLDPVVRLYHGDPDVVLGRGAVEVAGADERPASRGQPLGEGPAVADREPEVEAAGRQRHVGPTRRRARRPAGASRGGSARAGPRRGRRRRAPRRRRPGPARAPSSRRACAPPAGSATSSASPA